jgi:cytoskeletal protein RodZ
MTKVPKDVKNKAGFSTIEALLIIVIIALLAFVGGFVWHSKQTADKTLTAATSSSSSSSTVKQQAKATTPTSPSATQAASTTVFKIPELGIEITVPNAIKDIVYTVNPPGTLSTGQQAQSVTLSTQTLTNLDADCSVSGGAPALGTVSKVTGQYPTNPDVDSNNVSGGLVEQFPSYYIGWNSPQAACGTATTTNSEALADTNLFSTALDATVQPIQ